MTDFSHLYISPLERCNLCCKMCYTVKTSAILSNEAIENFIDRYRADVDLKIITFCGGEVMTLADFPKLVNKLTKNYFIQIITNGIIDCLEKFTKPNSVNIIVSLDSLPKFHDANRGPGMFAKSFNFLKKAQELGFHVEVFSIVTPDNYPHIKEFEKLLGKIDVTYHPQKPFTDASRAIWKKLKKNVFPPKNFGCSQISLMSDGKVYGCCEAKIPLADMNEPIEVIIDKFKKRLADSPIDCIEPDSKLCH